jgi:hypothetical protein
MFAKVEGLGSKLPLSYLGAFFFGEVAFLEKIFKFCRFGGKKKVR